MKETTKMDRETNETIHKYAKNLFRSCSIDELWTMEVMTEEDWKLNYDEERDQGIDYKTFISIVKTCIFLKETENYSILDEHSFFNAFSYFPN